METLESSRECRLCGKQCGILINIFDRNEAHVKKINAILPIMVHEMDLLPKYMCHHCSLKLEDFHKFYIDCMKTDANLKSQLSWMRNNDSRDFNIGVPMVHIENIKNIVKPSVCDMKPSIVENVDYINSIRSMQFPVNGVEPDENIAYNAYTPRCASYCDKTDQSNRIINTNFDRESSCMMSEVKREVEDDKTNLTSLLGAKMLKEERLSNEDSRPWNNSESTIVRNLRPRREFVNYAETKKNNRSKNVDVKPSIMKIKLEKVQDIEGRILRPRNESINYFGPKRKRSEKVRNIANRSNLENNVVLAIKNEELCNTENALKLSLNVADQIHTLSNKREDNSQNYRINRRTLNYKFKRHSSKLESERNLAMSLRSHDVCLRNGKIRKPVEKARKLRRSIENFTNSLGTNFKMGSKGIVKTSGWLVDVKRYCEECNGSFANNELYRLHACYGK